jgi:hypothetical protein
MFSSKSDYVLKALHIHGKTREADGLNAVGFFVWRGLPTATSFSGRQKTRFGAGRHWARLAELALHRSL